MATFRLLIQYDGSEWAGWQIQPDRPTVQGTIEDALKTILRTQVGITGSGRTDAGVHAAGQVAHFQTDAAVDPRRLRRALNGVLPPSIAVMEVTETRADFHARYDARLRRYRYRIATVRRPLERSTRVVVRPAPDLDRMNEAAALLVGTHDFSTFCRTSSETRNRVCTVRSAAWHPTSVAQDADFVIEADRFLHGMVRAIVGTLLDIGQGRRPVECVPALIAARDRTAAGPAAPAHGLTLEHVTYA